MSRFQAMRAVRALGAGVALGVMAHAAANAAEAAAPTNTGSDAAAPALGEVVVTAQKRQENVQKTPIAITAITAQRIDQADLNQQQKLQFTVPSMTYAVTAGFTMLSLRGVGTNTQALSESSVSTYQDGVYTGMIIGQTVPTFDLKRIEVLRGPQGTLYGRNTTGGVINYITKDPSFEFGAAGDVSYGDYNAVSANVGVTGPILGDKIAARASFHYNDHDGYYPNIATGQRDYADHDVGGRVAVLIRPTDNLSVIIRGDMSRDTSSEAYALIHTTGLDGLSDDTHPLGLFSEPASYFTAHPGLLSPSDIAKLNGGSIASYYGLLQPGPAAPNPLTTGTIANGEPTTYRADTSGASIAVNWDLGSVNVKSISGYRFGQLYNAGDVGGMSYPMLEVAPTLIRERQYTQEFNVSGKAFDSKLDWLVGAFVYHEDGYSTTSAYLPGYVEAIQAGINLANPPGSPYAYNLNPTALAPLSSLPGVFPSVWQTALFTGPGFPGDAAGSTVAGSTVPATGYFGQVMAQKSNSYAGFFQATYHVTDSLRVTGGFRYTVDQKTAHRLSHSNFAWDLAANGIYEAVQAGYLPAAAYSEAAIAGAAGLYDTVTSKTWSAPTGMINVDYDVAPHVLAYAKVSWGYKAGGMNPTESTHVYNPEYLTAYEGGVKAVLAHNQILANLAAYYYDYGNIQFTTYTANSASVLNAGSAKAFGLEFEYALRPDFAPGWQLDGSASFEDSHYGKGCFADPANLNNAGYLSSPLQACPATVINPNTGLAVAIAPSANISGNELIRAPRWKTNFGLQYASDIAGFGNILGRVDVAWTDKFYNDVLNGKATDLAQLTQPSYWIVNAQLVWTSPDKRYSAELFADNLGNSHYLNSRIAYNTPPTMYTVAGQLAPPRTYGLRLRMKLGSSY